LIGLDVRERQDTLPDALPGLQSALEIEDDWLDDAKTTLALKRRPLVIREGIDQAMVEQYRQEAERILASGVFETKAAS
jgi:hypothetical protein